MCLNDLSYNPSFPFYINISSTMSKNQFASRIGLIAATVGSAVGLGNIWRFPAETQSNGGAAFLLLYIICVFALGVPVMLAEFAIGRAGRNDAVGSFRTLSPGKPWWIVGAVGLSASYLIGIFYMVVAGWTLEYLYGSLTGELFEGVGHLAAGTDFSGADKVFTEKMNLYIATPWRAMLFTSLMILINIGVLLKGVAKGIERLSNVLMPLLFVVLIALCCVTLTLPGASAGIEWFLKPDFSLITARTVINALGQTFFSLSLGMGILITYSSYYPSNTRLGTTSVTVALASLLVAVLVGFVIFPAVASFGLTDHSLRGTTLVFQTLPEVFACMPGTRIWASLFFVLLFVAALTSTVSIMEVTVAFMETRCKLSRRVSVIVALCPLFVLSAICSLSFSSLSSVTLFGMNIFDLLDNFSTNILLPIAAIGTCVYLGWFAPEGLFRRQLTNQGTIKSRLNTAVIFIVRYVAPILIALILVWNLI